MLRPMNSRGPKPNTCVHTPGGESDAVLSPARPFPGPVGDWAAWLNEGLSREDEKRIHRHTRTDRPLGGAAFVDQLEHLVGPVLRPLKRGPKPKNKELK